MCRHSAMWSFGDRLASLQNRMSISLPVMTSCTQVMSDGHRQRKKGRRNHHSTRSQSRRRTHVQIERVCVVWHQLRSRALPHQGSCLDSVALGPRAHGDRSTRCLWWRGREFVDSRKRRERRRRQRVHAVDNLRPRDRAAHSIGRDTSDTCGDPGGLSRNRQQLWQLHTDLDRQQCRAMQRLRWLARAGRDQRRVVDWCLIEQYRI